MGYIIAPLFRVPHHHHPTPQIMHYVLSLSCHWGEYEGSMLTKILYIMYNNIIMFSIKYTDKIIMLTVIFYAAVPEDS